MVVPNGFLFGDGVAARVKQQLLADCDLHTIVRLPSGVFAPYTDIPTNLLFFEKTGRTRETWFYEVPPPVDRKKYSKTKPMHFEAFADCQAWWGGGARESRVETQQAWRVPMTDIENSSFNLDRKNPNAPEDLARRSPDELLSDLLAAEVEIASALEQLQRELSPTR